MGICALDLCQRNKPNRELKDLMSQVIAQQSEAKRLSDLRKEYECHQDTLEKERYEAVLQLQLSEQRLRRLQACHSPSSMAQLESELNSFYDWKKRYLLRTVLKRLRKTSSALLKDSWNQWHRSENSANSMLDIGTFDSRDENFIDLDSVNVFKDFCDKESQKILQSNPLMNLYQQHRTNSEKPLTYANTISLINEILDKKYESDNLDAKKNKKCKKLTDFTLEHLSRVYGLRKMTYSALCSLLPTLRDMYYQGNVYGILLCRLLQLYDVHPIPDDLSEYLLKARSEFNKLNLKSIDKFRKASMTDAANLLSSFFEYNRYVRGVALRHLEPKSVSSPDQLCFLMCYKMLKLGQTPERLFSMFTSEDTISEEELLDGLRKILDLYIPETDIEMVKKLFGVPVTKESFYTRFNVNIFYENNKTDSYYVSVIDFFNSLIKAYRAMQLKDIAWLRNWFSSRATLVNTYEEFSALMLTLDPSLEDVSIQNMFDECLELNREGVNAETFCVVAMHRHVADYGIRDFRRECIREKVVYRRRKSEILIAPENPTPVKKPDTKKSDTRKSSKLTKNKSLVV